MRLSLKSCSLALLMSATGALQAAPQHAVTLYDEAPKYPADFTHFDYVNPDAPKGGEVRRAATGTFDSLNPATGAVLAIVLWLWARAAGRRLAVELERTS